MYPAGFTSYGLTTDCEPENPDIMKIKCTLIPAVIATAITLNLTSTNARAAYCSGFSSYAHRITAIAQELAHEFRVHYRHLDAYRHLSSDISRVINEARHIDRLSHDSHASLHHIITDLEDLDRLSHHMHEVVDSAESSHWRGHAHGDTRHVHRLLSSLNNSIHSMQRLSEQLNRHENRHHLNHFDNRSLHGRHRQHRSLSFASSLLRIAFSTHH
jgi:hypothetical protein